MTKRALGLVLLLAACRSAPTPTERQAVIEPPDPRLEAVVVPSLETLEPAARLSVRRRELFLVETLAVQAQAEPAAGEKAAGEKAAGDSHDDAALGTAYGELGRAYQAFGYPASAVEPYRNAARLQPSEFRWPYYLAHLLAEAGDPGAQVWVRAARVLRPRYQPALLLEAELAFAAGKPDEAELLYRQATTMDSANAAAWFGVGLALAERGEAAAAIEAFETALASRPDADVIHYPLALAYRQLGEVERAQRHLELRGDLRPGVLDPILDEVVFSNPEAWASRGLTALRSGNAQTAAQQLSRAVALAPERHDIRLHLGAALAQLGELNGALAQYRAAAAVDPRSAPTHHNIGIVLGKLGDEEGSLAAHARAIELDPGHQASRFAYGRKLGLAHRYAESLTHLDALLDLDPGHLVGRLWRARALMGLDRHRQAFDEIETHRQLHPSDPTGRHVLARFLAVTHDRELRAPSRALEIATSLTRTGGNFEYLRTAAMAAAASGDYPGAMSWQQRALEAARPVAGSEITAELEAELEAYAAGQSVERQTW